jgi:hypothetical protein
MYISPWFWQVRPDLVSLIAKRQIPMNGFEQLSVLKNLNEGDLYGAAGLYDLVYPSLFARARKVVGNDLACEQVVFTCFVDYWLLGPPYLDPAQWLSRAVDSYAKRWLAAGTVERECWWTHKIGDAQVYSDTGKPELLKTLAHTLSEVPLPVDMLRKIAIEHFIRRLSLGQIADKYRLEEEMIADGKDFVLGLLEIIRLLPIAANTDAAGRSSLS